MTTTFRVVLAGLLLVAALVAPPAILANVVAGAGGRKINQPFLSHRGLKYFAFAK